MSSRSEVTKLLRTLASFTLDAGDPRVSETEAVKALEALAELDGRIVLPHLPNCVRIEKSRSTLDRLFPCPKLRDLGRVGPALDALIVRLLSAWPVADLPWLDERMRETGAYYSWWSGLSSVEPLLGRGEATSALIALATFHGNGHVREAAVRELSKSHTGVELPFLLIRLNDWVEPVRRLAEAEVARRATPDRRPEFVRALPLVARLKGLRRVDHDRVTPAIHAMLIGPGAGDSLLDGLALPDLKVRRECLRLLAGLDRAPWSNVFEMATRSSSVAERRWAAKHARSKLSNEQACDILGTLVRDPHVAVRSQVLYALMELLGRDSIEYLRNALMDNSGSVRQLARFYLRKFGIEEDYAAFYRTKVSTLRGRDRRSAVGGLGETGTAADVPVLIPVLESELSCDVRVALRALARLDFVSNRPILMRAMTDSRRGVRGLAARLCLSSINSDDESTLREYAASSLDEGTQLTLVRCAKHLDTWERLRFLLAFHPPQDSLLNDQLNTELRDWCRHYEHAIYAPRPATEKELSDLEQQLADAAAWTTVEARDEVADTLTRERAR